MIKYAGLIIIFLCAVYYGILLGERYKTHLQVIGEFITLIKFMKSRIEYFRTPFYEIFSIYAEKEQSILKNIGFIKSARENCFNAAVKKYKKSLYLNDSEYNILCVFGKELGRSGSEDQINNCDFCISQLTHIYETAESSLKKEVKLASSLSISVGLMIVIILL